MLMFMLIKIREPQTYTEQFIAFKTMFDYFSFLEKKWLWGIYFMFQSFLNKSVTNVLIYFSIPGTANLLWLVIYIHEAQDWSLEYVSYSKKYVHNSMFTNKCMRQVTWKRGIENNYHFTCEICKEMPQGRIPRKKKKEMD